MPLWGHGHREETMVWGFPLQGHKDMLGATLLGAWTQSGDKDEVWGCWHGPRVMVAAVPPGFSIEGPSQARIECDDKGDGSCDVRYWPTEPGLYAVHVVCDDEDIRDSPFMADIRPAPPDSWPDKVLLPMATHRSCCAPVLRSALLWPTAPHYTSPVGAGGASTPLCPSNHPSPQVKAFGPGLEPTGCIVDRPAEFTIDARGAGKGPLKLYAQVGTLGGCWVVLGAVE